MKKPNKAFQQKFLKWLDGWRTMAKGLVLATKFPDFIIATIVSVLVFGMVLQFFAPGTANLDLWLSVDLPDKLKILGTVFWNFTGQGQILTDWLLIFSLALVQGLLISTLILVSRERKKMNQHHKFATIDNLQTAGLATGLAILGAGCPSCGTSLIAPILGTIFSGGGYALAGQLTWILNLLSFLVAILALKKLGTEAYVIIITNKWRDIYEQK